MGDTKEQAKHNKIYGYLHDFGKLFVDIAKLAFGSLVLGTIIRWDIPHTTTFILGITFSAVVGTVGIILARVYKEE
jgi:site-specific recombinase